MAEAERLVVFTGAGISTDSGLPDFRGPDGVWTRQEKGLPPRDPKLDWTKTSPNQAHYAIVELQEMGKLDFVISQNIDDLHLSSGIRPELLAELHGNLARVRCIACEETYPKSDALERCACGGALKSSVVGFGDSLPVKDLTDSFAHAERCDLMIVIASWPTKRQMHWDVLLRARAVENQCYVVGVNRVGEGGGLGCGTS